MRTGFSGRQERRLVLLLCVLASVRVFVYSAAFPFFNNVDEQAHCDLVVKYASGQVPRRLAPMSAESARYFVLYGSPEFVRKPGQYPAGQYPPPLWTRPPGQVAGDLAEGVSYWRTRINHESSQAPLYYAAAALWMNAGQWCGLQDGPLLYWVRFLNVPLAAGLVWLGFVAARMMFPDRRFVRLGVPLLLAVFPQDIFYSIQSDVFSPLAFGLAFVCLLQWLRDESPGPLLGAATGLALAATCLVKSSNLPLLAVAAAALSIQVWRLSSTGKLRDSWPAVVLLILCAGLPIGCWVGWNLHVWGDLTGSADKIRYLGWTPKPLASWLPHPLLTPAGWWELWSELTATFWRGEFVWGLRPLAQPAMDVFYCVSSTLLVGLAMIGLLPRSTRPPTVERRGLLLCFCALAAGVGFLAALSLAFDFGNSYYPSRAHPYFVSGRLLAGALIPFLLLYVRGLDWAMSAIKNPWPRWVVLVAIAALVAGSQASLNLSAFASPYNWFHLLHGPA